MLLHDSKVPKWRNWQTQQTQNLPYANTCRFESGLRHHLKILASEESGAVLFCSVKSPKGCNRVATRKKRVITKQHNPNFSPFLGGKVGNGGFYHFWGILDTKISVQPDSFLSVVTRIIFLYVLLADFKYQGIQLVAELVHGSLEPYQKIKGNDYRKAYGADSR